MEIATQDRPHETICTPDLNFRKKRGEEKEKVAEGEDSGGGETVQGRGGVKGA